MLCIAENDPGLFLGYWQDEARTRAARVGAWFVTGDRAVMRADGAIRYLGRVDDQMNAQGSRVDPGEVEAVLMRHPGVAECGVAAREVSDGVQVIAAWIVPEGEVTAEALQAHAEQALAAYKCPRAYYFVSDLPRSANGKILRRALGRTDP